MCCFPEGIEELGNPELHSIIVPFGVGREFTKNGSSSFPIGASAYPSCMAEAESIKTVAREKYWDTALLSSQFGSSPGGSIQMYGFNVFPHVSPPEPEPRS